MKLQRRNHHPTTTCNNSVSAKAHSYIVASVKEMVSECSPAIYIWLCISLTPTSAQIFSCADVLRQEIYNFHCIVYMIIYYTPI